MPGMPGSFGRLSGPFAITTNRARIASPRLVETIQRAASSSQRSSVTRVWKQRVVVEVVVLCDALRVLEDLGREGVLLLRDVAELFEQRQVAVAFDVALGARIAVPVPGAAEVAAGL